MKKRVLITVKGKVQNVGFRFFTNKLAGVFGISGYVKNLPNGTVYIEAEGDEKDLSSFIDHVRSGPKWGRVDDMSIQEAPLANDRSFEIRH